jgi:hypothetical protein
MMPGAAAAAGEEAAREEAAREEEAGVKMAQHLPLPSGSKNRAMEGQPQYTGTQPAARAVTSFSLK